MCLIGYVYIDCVSLRAAVISTIPADVICASKASAVSGLIFLLLLLIQLSIATINFLYVITCFVASLITHLVSRVKKRVSKKVLPRVMYLIQSKTLGKTVSLRVSPKVLERVSARLLARLFALAKRLAMVSKRP